MEYSMTGGPTGWEQQELTKERFNELIRTKTALAAALEIEEKFDLMFENYTAFELCLLERSLLSLLHVSHEWAKKVEDRRAVNLCLSNLLSSCRMYLDHVPQKIRAIQGTRSQTRTEFGASRASYYESSLAYRTLETLRNYAQHCDQPISLAAIGWKRESLNEVGRVVCTPYISLSTIEPGRAFKKETYEELLAKYEDAIDLKPLVREYMSALGSIHMQLRVGLQTDLELLDAALEQVISDCGKSESGEMSKCAYVRGITASGDPKMEQFFRENPEQRQVLEKKNDLIRHFENYYVSGEVEGGQELKPIHELVKRSRPDG